MFIATGGHGLLWNALLLTEIGCHIDNLLLTISNDVHTNMSLIHCAMVLSLLEYPQGKHTSSTHGGHSQTDKTECSCPGLQPKPEAIRILGKIGAGIASPSPGAKALGHLSRVIFDSNSYLFWSSNVTMEDFSWASFDLICWCCIMLVNCITHVYWAAYNSVCSWATKKAAFPYCAVGSGMCWAFSSFCLVLIVHEAQMTFIPVCGVKDMTWDPNTVWDYILNAWHNLWC